MVGFLKADAIPYRPLLSSPRSLSSKFFAFLALVSLLYIAHVALPSFSLSLARRPRNTCPPRAWAAGQPEDAYEFLGLQGCASSREVYWHMGADAERLYDRFPGVASWKWRPSSECDIEELETARLLKDLVEHGGWFLVGDSVTENHFFSLSCILYPHVRATPDWTRGGFDRAWPQNLYLNPASPLLQYINFPPGFDIETTPLVTFRRIDLLYETAQLDQIYHRLHPHSKYAPNGESIFSDEPNWNVAPEEYLKLFTQPLPHGNYATMVVSTGGHWTTTMLAGLKDESLFHDGIENVVSFFKEAMDVWADEVQIRLLDAAATERQHGDRRRRAPRQVVVRAYLPGHEDCHNHRAPIKEYEHGPNGWYNWNQISDFNAAFESVLSSGGYPDLHFLPIDRHALLRPDAHAASDCLHFMTGAGVLEGWTHYIWHYVTRELPGRIR
ncbi:uncharacterized protein BXZ73DRAFT_81477 [Epithele typhae]|uniref:uncharacterized protein n=1 Tax=Epithele typhae TaxID=378194 RepID=UPI002007AC34|nr:uncharacterized protein BXZ73DRAFT_81477 [Epithele typhae]KAH9915048.1 hypothetical protein BXZ73DRAFT_81477 [Epithele typhae]